MKFQLKYDLNILSFLRAVDYCTGEVVFESRKGDRLDLKSQLSKYLFLTLRPGDAYLLGSRIECSHEDSKLLSRFLVIPE